MKAHYPPVTPKEFRNYWKEQKEAAKKTDAYGQIKKAKQMEEERKQTVAAAPVRAKIEDIRSKREQIMEDMIDEVTEDSGEAESVKESE
jgi:hypothetical protein